MEGTGLLNDLPAEPPSIFEALPNSRSVRLMRLGTLESNANDGDFHSPLLGCQLECFDVDNCPPYEALSYPWGEALQTNIVYTEDDEAQGSSDRSIPLYIAKPCQVLRDLKSMGEPDTNNASPADIDFSPYLITKNLEDALQQLSISGLDTEWL